MSATQEPSGTMRAEDAIKDFWATRPRRPRRGRKIAGVAAGIANRYRIDPVLVRIGFVVATIYGGAGILVYLLGWLSLAEQDDEVSPIESVLGKGRSSTSTGFTILLCIALVPVMGWFFGNSPIGSFPTWLSLVVIGGLLFLLHQSRGGLGPVPQAPAAAAPPTMQMTTPLTTPPVSSDAPPAPPTWSPVDAGPAPTAAPEPSMSPVQPDYTPASPPAWDPLGAAPFAWDLPDPTPPVEPEELEPPVKRHKPRVGTATIGIALVVAAGMSFAMGGWITPQHIIGIVLAVVGLGLVAGAFLRGGRGLIALAVPLSVIGLGLTAVSPDGWNGLGELTARPSTVASVEDRYVRSVGNVELDLRGLPDTGVVRTEAMVDIGNVEVIVPRDADVTVTCETDRGNIECLDREESGLDKRIKEYTDLGDNGTGGLVIHLVARSDTGNVEVRRG